MSTLNPNVKFMTISEFKIATGCNTLAIVKNPNTGKLFAQSNTGKNFRCKGALDITKPMSVLIESGDLDNACIVNGSSNNVLATL